MNRDEIIQFLSKLVSYDTTINPSKMIFPPRECADFLHRHARDNGWEVLTPECNFRGNPDIPLFPVLVAKRSMNSGPTILFLGHIDVVPVSEAERPEWNFEPFEPTVDGDVLRGRGSGDMKGGVTAFFAAFDTFDLTHGNLVIALSGDEEIGGLDTVPDMIKALEEKNLSPDFVINAEGAGDQVIVTQRRGGTQVALTFALDLQVAKGTRKSRSFTSSLADGGQSLHSMSFVLGSDTHAMIAAGKFSMDKNIISVSSSSIKTNSVPKEVVVDYIDYRGTNEIEYSAGLTKMMHALSSIGSIPLPIDKSKYGPAINPNLLDIDRDTGTVTVTFDIRSMVQASAHHLIAEEIQRHFAHYGLMTEYELQLVIDPVNVSPDHPLAVLTNEIAEKHGFQILTRGEKLGGASDTRFFTSLEIPGIELGPLAHNAHGTNEAVDLTSIEKLRDIYQELVQDILAGKLG